LRPEVRDQLIKIAEDFLLELGVNDLDVKDITISGSNAAFSYTKHSDLDLHILVDMGNLPVDEVYKELFNAKKTIYNDSHDITIHTIPVELYVQDSRDPVVSLGEYSVMNDDWIKIPTKRRSDFDQTATKSKYEKLLSLIEMALKSRKYSKVKHIIDTIKRYRQAGLDKGGEFGPENLAYKMLRSQGYITKLYDLRDKLHSEKLSFETMYQNIDEAFDTPLPITWEKGMHGDVDALAKLPDGTNLSIMFNKQDNIKPDDKTWMVEFYRNNSQEVTGEGDAQKVFSTVLVAIQQFITKYKPLKIYFSASKEIDPTINYGPDDVVPNPESRAKLYDRMVLRYAKSWGYKFFRADNGDLVMYQLSRIPKQKAVGENQTKNMPRQKVDPTFNVSEEINPDVLDPRFNHKQKIGDYTYIAGLEPDEWADEDLFVIRCYDGEKMIGQARFYTTFGDSLVSALTTVKPEYQKQGIASTMYAYARMLGNTIEPSASQLPPGKKMWKAWKKSGDAQYLMKNVEENYTMQYASEKTPPVSPYAGIKDNQYRGGISEASGYIPSEKQKNDPRFKTALTVDINPYTMKKGAKQFGWNISRAGIPPTAKANGKV
jgi:hypothetical protein